MAMAVLVTGGTGFLGLNLAEALLAAGETVVLHGHVAPPAGAVEALSAGGGRLAVELGDVRDAAVLAGLMRAHGVDRLIQAAAITPGAERERDDPATILEVNVIGTVRALEAARAAGVARVVQMSSGAAYGLAQEGRDELDEIDSPAVPVTVYGTSKLAAERTALRLADLWGLDLTAVRLGPLFGRWEWATGVRDVLSPVTRAAALALAGETVVLPHEGRLDWLYTADGAAGLVHVLGRAGLAGRVFNLGTGNVWSVADWCRLLAARDPGFAWRMAGPGEAGNVPFLAQARPPLATRRLEAATGFVAGWDMARAFDDYLPWMRRHPVPR